MAFAQILDQLRIGYEPEKIFLNGDQAILVGRVEDWRGIPKVRPICCSPFPLGVPQ